MTPTFNSSNPTSTAAPAAAAARDVGSNWRQDAACLSEDPELFFPIGTTGPAIRQAEEARTICRRCPVLIPCLTWALDTGVEHGVWGGQTEEERRAQRRRRNRTSRISTRQS